MSVTAPERFFLKKPDEKTYYGPDEKTYYGKI